jgi:hypothetical protein
MKYRPFKTCWAFTQGGLGYPEEMLCNDFMEGERNDLPHMKAVVKRLLKKHFEAVGLDGDGNPWYRLQFINKNN